MQTKKNMAQTIGRLLSPHNQEERQRIIVYQMSRTLEQVKESFDRVLSLEHVTKKEIAKHCQFP